MAVSRTKQDKSQDSTETLAFTEDADAFSELEAELALLVRALEAVQRRRSYPLERAHYLLIRLVEEEGPQTIGAAARRLFLDDSTVTRQVATMEQLGLIRKESNPADARSSVIHVTRTGFARAGSMRRQRLYRMKRLFARWTPPERRTCAKVLARLNTSLAEVIAAPD
jgi:DNA-binding MarR family transcriptional regulator